MPFSFPRRLNLFTFLDPLTSPNRPSYTAMLSFIGRNLEDGAAFSYVAVLFYVSIVFVRETNSLRSQKSPLAPSLALIMPPRKQQQVSWKPEHAQLLQKGFHEHGWDPLETDGKTIKSKIQSVPKIFEPLKPFFSLNEGGTRSNNNGVYQHYKTQGSEYITLET